MQPPRQHDSRLVITRILRPLPRPTARRAAVHLRDRTLTDAAGLILGEAEGMLELNRRNRKLPSLVARFGLLRCGVFQPSTRHLKAALAGVLFAWLCLLQGAYGLANLGPEVRDPANFLPPRILVGADVTTSIKPSRPQTLDRQRTASGIPDWLSRDPLAEKEDLNLYRLTGNDPINFVDRDGLAKVALDGKGNLTPIGQIILDIAKGDPKAARSLLMAKQVDAESAGIKVTGDAGEDSIRNVMRAIETAVGDAQSDGRREWQRIAAEAGLSGERSFGGYKDAWMTAKLAEYAPQIAANAGAALQLRAAERAANDKATAYQNSAAYKLREFADAPFDVVADSESAPGQRPT